MIFLPKICVAYNYLFRPHSSLGKEGEKIKNVKCNEKRWLKKLFKENLFTAYELKSREHLVQNWRIEHEVGGSGIHVGDYYPVHCYGISAIDGLS